MARLHVRDIAGYGTDLDLAGLEEHWPADITMTPLTHICTPTPFRDPTVTRYEAIYRRHGPWALPPAVCLRRPGGLLFIAGNHRAAAAHHAGLPAIPTHIVKVPPGEPPYVPLT